MKFDTKQAIPLPFSSFADPHEQRNASSSAPNKMKDVACCFLNENRYIPQGVMVDALPAPLSATKNQDRYHHNRTAAETVQRITKSTDSDDDDDDDDEEAHGAMDELGRSIRYQPVLFYTPVLASRRVEAAASTLSTPQEQAVNPPRDLVSSPAAAIAWTPSKPAPPSFSPTKRVLLTTQDVDILNGKLQALSLGREATPAKEHSGIPKPNRNDSDECMAVAAASFAASPYHIHSDNHHHYPTISATDKKLLSAVKRAVVPLQHHHHHHDSADLTTAFHHDRQVRSEEIHRRRRRAAVGGDGDGTTTATATQHELLGRCEFELVHPQTQEIIRVKRSARNMITSTPKRLVF